MPATLIGCGAIYNHYVIHDVATFEEEPVSAVDAADENHKPT